jgi:hypothetical protein
MTTEPQLTQDDELLALLDAEGDARTKILTKVIRRLKESQSDLEKKVKESAGRTKGIILFTAFTFTMCLLLTLAGGAGYVLSQSKEDKNTIESRLANLQQTIAVVQATQIAVQQNIAVQATHIAMSTLVVTPSPAPTPTFTSTPTFSPATKPTPTPTTSPTLSPTAEKLPSPSPSTATPTLNPLPFWVEELKCQTGQMKDKDFLPSSSPAPCIKQDSKVSIKENEALQITFDIYANSDMNFEISLYVYQNEKQLRLLCDASPRPVQVRAGTPMPIVCTGQVGLPQGDYRIEIWGQSGNKFKNKEGSDIGIPLTVEKK